MIRQTILFLLLFSIFGANTLYSQISPGKLSRFHKDIEGITNCTKCHELGKDVSNDKCLECHLSVRNRINSGNGYHNSKDVTDKQCAKCHSDHHGREFELIYWKDGKDKFDHNLTGYSLEAKHRLSECEKCHIPPFISKDDVKTDKNNSIDRTLIGLNSSACITCHHDEHGNQLTDRCLDCHNYEGWKPTVGFDHDSTSYQLTGKHIDTDCEKCHKLLPALPPVFPESIPKPDSVAWYAEYSDLDFVRCKSCHEDTHKGKLGNDCKKCHQTSGFKNIIGGDKQFDHSQTDYKLEGRHIGVDCKKCHTTENLTDDLKYKFCIDCHKDEHQEQFADRPDKGACESCHIVDRFLPSNYDVEQHQKSRYPLTGSHLATPCIACHKEIEIFGRTCACFDFPDLSCIACHKDTHEGQADKWIKQTGCDYCHTTDSWRKVETFDHDSSRFKLVEKHQKVACLDCHQVADTLTETERIVLQPLDMNCIACHEDIHQGQFVQLDIDEKKTTCDRCHSSKSWKELMFDHNRDSRYKLDGAHIKVACIKCHPQLQTPDGKVYIAYKPLGMECADCHGGSVPKESK